MKISNILNLAKRTFLIATLLIMSLMPGIMVPASTGAFTETKTHVFKFYLDPSLVPDMSYAQQVLPKYVQDMNYILAKNTSRQLLFDPATGINLSYSEPQSNSAGVLPVSGYEVWAHAVRSGTAYSHSGYISFDQSGSAVLAGLKWASIYDPDTLQPGSFEAQDYWTQINILLHEYAHVYGAGMGEYYNLLNVTDTTGVQPQLNINYNDTADKFWRSRTQYDSDPLLFVYYNQAQTGGPASRQLLLDHVLYSPLTASIMSGDYRQPSSPHPTVDLQNIRIRVLDSRTNAPVKNSRVRVWNVKTVSPFENSLLVDTSTNSAGEIIFAWGGSPRSSLNMLRLIKVEPKGYQPAADYVSIYDLDEARLVQGSMNYSHAIKVSRKNN